MARPLKTKLSYITEDTILSPDDEICFLEIKYKNDGYSVFRKLLRKIASSNGLIFDLNISEWQMDILLKKYFLVDKDTYNKIIDDCVNTIGVFDKKLFKVRNMLFSNGLIQRADEQGIFKYSKIDIKLFFNLKKSLIENPKLTLKEAYKKIFNNDKEKKEQK